jgi:RND family efflux transporter MFP subunit
MRETISTLRLRPLCTAALLAATAALSPIPSSSVAHSAEAQHFVCQVLASERVELASPVDGVLDTLLVDRGATVHKGDVVATLNSVIQRVQVDLAKARANSDAQLRAKKEKHEFEARKLARNGELVKQRLVSANDIDQLKTDTAVAEMDVATVEESLAVAKLEYQKAKTELEIRSIRSPIDGIVTERRLSAGELVRDKPIMVIAKTDPLHAEVSLPVNYFGAITAGTKAEIVFSVPGLPTREATASLVDRFIDAASNTFGVRFVVPNPDNEIPAGTKCEVRFPDVETVSLQNTRSR